MQGLQRTISHTHCSFLVPALASAATNKGRLLLQVRKRGNCLLRLNFLPPLQEDIDEIGRGTRGRKCPLNAVRIPSLRCFACRSCSKRNRESHFCSIPLIRHQVHHTSLSSHLPSNFPTTQPATTFLLLVKSRSLRGGQIWNWAFVFLCAQFFNHVPVQVQNHPSKA